MGNICPSEKPSRKKVRNAEIWLSKPSNKIGNGVVFKDVYKISSNILGQGRTSTVWVGYDRATKKAVAVKRCSKKLLQKKKTGNNRVSEIEILLRAHEGGSCDKIVRLIGTYEDSTYLYLVSDFCRGGDMHAYISTKSQFSEADASSIGKNILLALHHLHKRGIVHRDLKPENILFVNESGSQIQLADFGSAALLSKGMYLSEEVGSPFFMAPEIKRDSRYNSAADMFSFGVLIYVMVSGMKNCDTTKDLNGNPIWIHLQSGHVPQLPENTSPTLEDFLSRLLTLDPNRRMTAKAALEHPWISGRAILQKEPLSGSMQSAKSVVESRGRSVASSKVYYVQDESNKVRRTVDPSVEPTEVWKKPARSSRSRNSDSHLPSFNQHKFTVEVLDTATKQVKRKKKSKSVASSQDFAASECSYISQNLSEISVFN